MRVGSGGTGVGVAARDHCQVTGWFVGGAVGPAAPDDAQPRAGQDPDGVGVVVPADSGAGVDVLGPGAAHAAAVGEVDEGLAQVVVAAAAEHDVVGPPGGRVEGAMPAAPARASSVG